MNEPTKDQSYCDGRDGMTTNEESMAGDKGESPKKEPVQFQIIGRTHSASESSVWQRLPKAIGELTDAGFEVTLVKVYRDEI